MSYFRGNHALVMLMIIMMMHRGSQAAAVAAQENQHPNLFEYASREEVVQMAGYGEEKLSTILITGSLHCHPHPPRSSWPIPGASVVVNCHSHVSKRKGKSTVVARGATDEFGDFMVDLPSHLHAIPNLEKVCTVKVHRIPKGSLCQPARVTRHKQLSLSSFGNGIRTYSAGNIRLQHSTCEGGKD